MTFLHVSGGTGSFDAICLDNFEHSKLVYLGAKIKEHVSIPIIAVGGITKPRQAEDILNSGFANLVAIGRGTLVDKELGTKSN